MKKGWVIIMFFSFFSWSAEAQNFATFADTARYLMDEIAAKKSQYIGKPLSTLLDSLKISPARFGIDWTPPADSLKGLSGILDFNFATEFERAHYLIIDWQNPLPWDAYAPAMRTSFQDLINLYKPIIIKDIAVKDYYTNPDWLPQLQNNTAVESNAVITWQQKNIVSHRTNRYYNQPFSVLWNALAVKPKTVCSVSDPGDNSLEEASTFFYEGPDKLSITYFTVWWSSPIPKQETWQYQLSMIRDFTNPAEYEIYANKVIYAIEVFPNDSGLQ